jgi:hypothetical protein
MPALKALSDAFHNRAVFTHECPTYLWKGNVNNRADDQPQCQPEELEPYGHLAENYVVG